MDKIFFATGNLNKAKEVQEILKPLGIEIVTIRDFDNFTEVPETGATFEENALIKARNSTTQTGLPALADDSGLCVDALDGAPGIFSARYSGEHGNDDKNNAKLLEELKNIPQKDRGAHYTAVFALVLPDGREFTTEGRLYGVITDEPRGENGFGYDPLFYLPEKGLTVAELTTTAKNSLSHRGEACRKMLKHLTLILDK